MAVFQSLFSPETVNSVKIQSKIQLGQPTLTDFSLTVISNQQEWRGFYIACIESLNLRCDFAQIGEKQIEDLASKTYRAPFDAQTKTSFKKEFQLFFGYQNLFIEVKTLLEF